MGYIQNNLLTGEEVKYEAQLHWWIFARQVLWVVLAWVLLLTEKNFLVAISWIILALSVIGLIRMYLLKSSSQYVVTNKRVILKTGLIKRDMLELMLNKSEGIRIRQSLLGRLLGFGSILVTTGGVSNSFDYIVDPLRFRNQVAKQLDAVQGN